MLQRRGVFVFGIPRNIAAYVLSGLRTRYPVCCGRYINKLCAVLNSPGNWTAWFEQPPVN